VHVSPKIIMMQQTTEEGKISVFVCTRLAMGIIKLKSPGKSPFASL